MKQGFEFCVDGGKDVCAIGTTIRNDDERRRRVAILQQR